MTLEEKFKEYLIAKYPYNISEVEAILIAHDIAQIAEEGREVIAEVPKSDCTYRRLIVTEFNDIGQNRQRDLGIIPNNKFSISLEVQE